MHSDGNKMCGESRQDNLGRSQRTDRFMVLPVSERGDYKSVCAAEEFILVAEIDIRYGDKTFVLILLEVES